MVIRPKLREKIENLPNKPGVYLMRDRLGRVIYVGKARALKKRVLSYFQPARRSAAEPKLQALVDSIYDFDIQVVKNEPEAILLEGKLIKDYKPKYYCPKQVSPQLKFIVHKHSPILSSNISICLVLWGVL